MLKDKIRKLIICGAAAIILVAPFAVLAINDVTINGPVNFEFNIIDAPFTQTIIVGQQAGTGTVTELTVNTSDMIIKIDPGSAVRFDKTSASTYFKVTQVSGIAGDYTLLPICPDNYIDITGGATTVELKIEMTTVRPGCLPPITTIPGGQVDVYPTDYSVNINNGATCSISNSVTLNLACNNASEVMISNNSDFSGAVWQNFNFSSKPWTLLAGNGVRAVYVQYKSSVGRISPVLSASIEVKSAGCVEPPVEPPVEPGICRFDCKKVTYDLYIVNPDGSERHSGTNYVRSLNIAKDVYEYRFEDKGSDFDYNDVVIMVDKSDCGRIKVNIVSTNSGWRHQVKMLLYYGGSLKENLLLWADDHEAGIGTKTLELSSYNTLCEKTTLLNYGDLLKGSEETVYYYASDGRRYVFPNPGTYRTWYSGYSKVKNVTDSVLATISLGKNITYRPGVRIVKITTDPKVYAVDSHGTLRWIVNEIAATALYGSNWQSYIDDVSDAFFVNYKIGVNINGLADFNPSVVTANAGDLENDLVLR